MGSFITYEGPSPGACEETDGSPPGVLDAGVLGTMHGYILTLVTCDPSRSRDDRRGNGAGSNADTHVLQVVNTKFALCGKGGFLSA
jgi:hypothetical protein